MIDIPRQRLANQHLAGTPLHNPTAVVEWLGAVQAQDYPAARWALALRSSGTAADIDVCFNQGDFLRTHVMRPTWHFVNPADIRWLLDLTSERVLRTCTTYYRQHQLDHHTLSKTSKLIAQTLRHNVHLTKAEISQVLSSHGFTGDALHMSFILMHAELTGIICSGALKGKQQTYALIDDRAPQARPLTHDQALVELITRYVRGHGPAQAQDFSWWSGLTMSDARRAIEQARLEPIIIAGKTYWHEQLLPAAPGESILLLPNYDELLIAFKDRSDSVRIETPTSAIFEHALVANGQVVGSWKVKTAKDRVALTISLFQKLNSQERALLGAQIERYEHFVGLPVQAVLKDL